MDPGGFPVAVASQKGDSTAPDAVGRFRPAPRALRTLSRLFHRLIRSLWAGPELGWQRCCSVHCLGATMPSIELTKAQGLLDLENDQRDWFSEFREESAYPERVAAAQAADTFRRGAAWTAGADRDNGGPGGCPVQSAVGPSSPFRVRAREARLVADTDRALRSLRGRDLLDGVDRIPGAARRRAGPT